MIQNSHQSSDFMMSRAHEDRRTATQDDLPYMCDEGMVMIDRRELHDRRAIEMHARQADESVRQLELVR